LARLATAKPFRDASRAERAAFATTSVMPGMYQTRMPNNAGIPIVLPAAFFFGGPVRIIVAIMESSGNLFAGAVPGTYGPFCALDQAG
jgi:succinate-acetate transporter protein